MSVDTSVHPLLVAAVKAEYLRALAATDLLQQAAMSDDPVLRAKADLVRSDAYAEHPDFVSEGLPVREMLLRMFGSEDIVDQALEIVWADPRCFEARRGDAAAPVFKGMGCVNCSGAADGRCSLDPAPPPANMHLNPLPLHAPTRHFIPNKKTAVKILRRIAPNIWR